MNEPNHSDRLSCSERVMLHIDEYCSTDENGQPKFTDADLEAVVDASAGDPEVNPAQRIAANWLLRAGCGNGTDATKAIERLLNRQLGSPRQSTTIDTRVTYHKEVSWDQDTDDRPVFVDPTFRPTESPEKVTGPEFGPLTDVLDRLPERHPSRKPQE